MIRQPALSTVESEADDHSMRFVEYAMAAIALVTAGVLALLR